MLTHKELNDRALRWLTNTRHCQPVFSECASCSEIPDAIGWSSFHEWRGSTVIECKTSISDFYADNRKYVEIVEGEKLELSRMGNYRFFLCEPGVIKPEQVETHVPDHGLLYCHARIIRVVRPAMRRAPEKTDLDSEIRYLRFAIVNNKKPYFCEGEIEPVPEQEPLIPA